MRNPVLAVGAIPTVFAQVPGDYLRGLKENVIVGRLIPAGPGMPVYREVYLEKERASPGQPNLWRYFSPHTRWPDFCGVLQWAGGFAAVSFTFFSASAGVSSFPAAST